MFFGGLISLIDSLKQLIHEAFKGNGGKKVYKLNLCYNLSPLVNSFAFGSFIKEDGFVRQDLDVHFLLFQ